MMSIIYLTLDQALEVHRKTVEISGGGTTGLLEIGKLESVLTHIQNDDYYPEFEDKITHLFFSTCKFHCFQDGNKRLAITVCAQMLLQNGYLYCSDKFIREMENISYYVAKDVVDKEFLREIVSAIVYNEFDSESFKLKMYNVIKDSV
jgi:death-on-curing protein